MAQNVYSLNIVGYVNVAVPAGSAAGPAYTLIGNPLKASPDNTVLTVLGTQLPSTASILTWTGVGFEENQYTTGGGWDIPDAVIAPGTGFFVKNPTTTAGNITFVGEVLAGVQTTVMDKAFNLVSSKTPVAGDLSTGNLNLTNAVPQDSILTWSGVGYEEDQFTASGWDYPPTVGVAQAFFYKQAGAVHTVNWVTIGFP
jgi:hypothetical protein